MLNHNEFTMNMAEMMLPDLRLYERERIGWHWKYKGHSSESQQYGGFSTAIGALCHFSKFLAEHSTLG